MAGRHFVVAALYLIFLVVIFIGMGATVLAVVQGPVSPAGGTTDISRHLLAGRPDAGGSDDGRRHGHLDSGRGLRTGPRRSRRAWRARRDDGWHGPKRARPRDEGRAVARAVPRSASWLVRGVRDKGRRVVSYFGMAPDTAERPCHRGDLPRGRPRGRRDGASLRRAFDLRRSGLRIRRPRGSRRCISSSARSPSSTACGSDGHPWLKPVRFHRSYRPGFDAWGRPDDAAILPGVTDFFRVEGDEVHEVAVGPVHAGVIEPGHFRFQCHGEQVFHLEIALGYQHRGIERRPGRRADEADAALHGDRRRRHDDRPYACLLPCRRGPGPSRGARARPRDSRHRARARTARQPRRRPRRARGRRRATSPPRRTADASAETS